MTHIKNNTIRPMDARLYFDDFATQQLWMQMKQAPPMQISPLPATNLTELTDRYVIEIYAPGLSLDDLDIQTTDNILDIRYEVAQNEFVPMQERRVWHQEFRTAPFQRRFELNPEIADVLGLAATSTHGVFRFEIPKRYGFQGKVEMMMPFSWN